jgi:hypothetical protein
VLLGALPLNGYLLFLFWPGEFHQDTVNGSVLLLLIGLIPLLIGAVSIAIGSSKAWYALVVGSVGVSVGTLMSLPAIINGKDHKAWLCWLAIFAFGVVLAAAIRTMISLISKEGV